jgi:7-cyano-7-deazaguanine tRNA-ribosyltransferase
MGVFEVRDRDGLARLGRLSTPHGPIDTPALFPVVHPDPARQTIPPVRITKEFGLPQLITSAYITWRTPPLKERALRSGIHGLLGTSGPVMTDSGAFQQHAYGKVEVGHDEILEFQRAIGSDISTVLDIFVEPDVPREEAAQGVDVTLARAAAARERTPGLLAVPVQGGTYADERRRSAEGASALADVLAVGGVVPLMEQYRFAELARVLANARPGLAPQCPVHLFGTGHPMTFAFAALFGVDLFDSSAYHKFARRGSLLFPDGTVSIDALREPICACRLCSALPLADVAKLAPAERERRIAEHNLLTSATEVSVVRQAIRDGNLWELVERRAAAHPAMRTGLREALVHPTIFLATEPESRRSYRVNGPESVLRPAILRFHERLARFPRTDVRRYPGPRPPLIPEVLRYIPSEDRSGQVVHWECDGPFGSVPLELSELYPVGAVVTPEDFLPRAETYRIPSVSPETFAADEFEPGTDWTDAWTRRHMDAILSWTYGDTAAAALRKAGVRAERSRRTGRLRMLRLGAERAFAIGNDGIPRPGWTGGRALHAAVAPPGLRVIVRDDAVDFVRGGRSLFAVFAQVGDPQLHPGASCLLVDREDRFLAVGRLLLAPSEIGRLSRGIVAWVTSHERQTQPPPIEEEAPALVPGDEGS